MIYEYAIDPAALGDFTDFRYYWDASGIHKGRLIAKFPNNWARIVLENSNTPMTRKRIEELMSKWQRYKLIDRKRTYEQEVPWTGNAIREHAHRQFRLIVCAAPPEIHNGDGKDDSLPDYVTIAAEVDESNDLWNVQTAQPLNRSEALRIAECCRGLLRLAGNFVTIVDPFFGPEKGYSDTFKQLYSEFLANNQNELECRVVSQAKDASHYRTMDLFDEQLKTWQDKVTKYHSRLIPRGKEVDFVVVNRPQDDGSGKKLHDRYIITDVGAVTIGAGFQNTSSSARDDSKTILELVSTIEAYESLLNEYSDEQLAPHIAIRFRVSGKAV